MEWPSECYEHTSLDHVRSHAQGVIRAWRCPRGMALAAKQRPDAHVHTQITHRRGGAWRTPPPRAPPSLYLSSLCRPAITREPRPGRARAYPRVRRSSLACRRSRCRRCCPPFACLGSGGSGSSGAAAGVAMATRARRERGDERRPVGPFSDRVGLGGRRRRRREVSLRTRREPIEARINHVRTRVCGGKTIERARPRVQPGHRAGEASDGHDSRKRQRVSGSARVTRTISGRMGSCAGWRARLGAERRMIVRLLPVTLRTNASAARAPRHRLRTQHQRRVTRTISARLVCTAGVRSRIARKTRVIVRGLPLTLRSTASARSMRSGPMCYEHTSLDRTR